MKEFVFILLSELVELRAIPVFRNQNSGKTFKLSPQSSLVDRPAKRQNKHRNAIYYCDSLHNQTRNPFHAIFRTCCTWKVKERYEMEKRIFEMTWLDHLWLRLCCGCILCAAIWWNHERSTRVCTRLLLIKAKQVSHFKLFIQLNFVSLDNWSWFQFCVAT